MNNRNHVYEQIVYEEYCKIYELINTYEGLSEGLGYRTDVVLVPGSTCERLVPGSTSERLESLLSFYQLQVKELKFELQEAYTMVHGE